jgi:transcriptional regulator with XRE-family HTH domain
VTAGSTESPADDHSSQNLEAIGSAIRKLRKERGLALRDLSRRSGLSTGFLSLVERGLSSPALTSLQAIAKALETNVTTFFKTDEAPQDSGFLTVRGRVTMATSQSQPATGLTSCCPAVRHL